jgi:catechol 2,3-dioxygenase-like lactoylglutathione lyase family enzyme
MAVLTGVSPVLLVADLQRSVDYFSDRLGSECDVFGDPPNFATAARDAAVILIADAIYAEVQKRGAGIDYTIYNAPHGFREFGVQDPDGHDIAFGQPLEA